MPFAPFSRMCTEIAQRETRTLTVFPTAKLGLPPANYEFDELYCDERGCDCRRVMFYVLSSATMSCEAVIAWGWESRAFYREWLSIDDERMVRELQGPVLNLGSPQRAHAPALLELAANVLLQDPAYVERVKRHYALFRAEVDRAAWQEHGMDRERKAPGRGRPPKGKKRRRRGGL